MSYQHMRRLTEHWPENTKGLSRATSFLAATIAFHLNAKTNSFSMSAKSLSKWTNGSSRSTVDRAVRELVALGVFQVSRDKQRQPRAFKLLVECPAGCERLKDHNTKLELKNLYGTEPAKEPQGSSESESLTQLVSLTNSVGQVEATNRYPININNKKDDMKRSFEFLFITETLEALKTSNEYTANHALLSKALLEIPELIEEKAKAIQARATHSPEKYLFNSITKSPTSLIPRQEKKTQEAKPEKFWTGLKIGKTWTGELSAHWRHLKENQELVDWSELDTEHINFLAHLYKEHTPISNTAANLVSEAAERKIYFSPYWNKEPDAIKPRSLTELSELLKTYKPKQPPTPTEAITQETNPSPEKNTLQANEEITTPKEDLDLALASLRKARELTKRLS